MSLTIHSVAYGSQTIEFELRRSSRKTLTIHVHPDMNVEVVAPENAEIDKINEKVRKWAKWIKKQQIFFEQFHPRTLQRQYVSGENHHYLGQQLRLKIKRDIVNEIKVAGKFIFVSSHYPNKQKLTKQLTEDWFKARAQHEFRERLALCIEKFSNPEKFTPRGLIIRQLSNRWGSMTSEKRLVLNTRLIHAPLACIDYVIIHELCHIEHPNHGAQFWRFLTTVLPDWQKRKNQLDSHFS